MNKTIGRPQPLFLRRIHEQEAARKKEKEEEDARRRKIVLALDVCIAALKAGQKQQASQRRVRRTLKKDFLSHLGDFVFGEIS